MADDDDPKKKWSSLVGSLGRDLAKLGGGLQKAIRDASESDAAKQVKGALSEVGPAVKKAAQSIGPEIQKVVEQVRPDVERAVSQLRPEVERIVGEAKPVIQGAIGDLLGRERRDEAPPPATSSSPPNISPDVAESDEDEEEHTRPDAQIPSPPADQGAGEGATKRPGKTIGRKPPKSK